MPYFNSYPGEATVQLKRTGLNPNPAVITPIRMKSPRLTPGSIMATISERNPYKTITPMRGVSNVITPSTTSSLSRTLGTLSSQQPVTIVRSKARLSEPSVLKNKGAKQQLNFN